jgi:hypothetical protein
MLLLKGLSLGVIHGGKKYLLPPTDNVEEVVDEEEKDEEEKDDEEVVDDVVTPNLDIL